MQISLTRTEAIYLRETFQRLTGEADKNPGSIGHLVWRTWIAEMLEALTEDSLPLATEEQAKILMLFLTGDYEEKDSPFQKIRNALSVKLAKIMIAAGLLDPSLAPPEEE